MDSEQLSLRWQDHHDSLVAVFENLLRNSTLVDCTIAAEGQYLKAHKVILSACSPYFQLLLKEESEKHPIIILKDVKFRILKAVIDFVYRGEVKICENQLATFLEVAESLQIKGLGTNDQENDTKRKSLPGSQESGRETCTSPIPRKRLRRKQTSISEGDNRVCSPENVSDQTSNLEFPSQHQTHCVDIPSTSSATIPAVSTFHTESNSGSAASEARNDDFNRVETSQSSQPPFSSDASLPQSSVPVVKTEPETELYYEPKIEFSNDTKEEFAEGTAVADGMNNASERQSEPVREPPSPRHGYSDFTSSYAERSDLPSDSSFVMTREGDHHASQDAGTGNVETIDIASDDSSFHAAQMEHGHSEVDTLLREMQRKAPAPREQRCPECHKTLRSSWALKQHMRTHTGERPYSCADCQLTFRQMINLQRHRRIHTGERPFRCDICDAPFARKYALQEHRRRHYGQAAALRIGPLHRPDLVQAQAAGDPARAGVCLPKLG